jgi:DNA-binding NtrC family response regulator
VSAAKAPRILVVDDEPNVGMIFHRILGEEGYDVSSAANGPECLRSVKRQAPDLIFMDVRMPGMDGVETLRRLRETHAQLPVVIMTAYQTVSSAVQCMRLGAFDYLLKPLDTGQLKAIARQALELGKLAAKSGSARAPAPTAEPVEETIAAGPEMKRILGLVEKVAPTDLTVLVLGESGTGKELVARAVHRRSAKSGGPFVVVDCAALPESLIESELFGYEKGAFTGADASKPGKFESADGGTLFLDEIGNLPAGVQAKLLRFLQEPTVERLGSRKGPVRLNVRIVAATNADLDAAVREGTFREDLLHRLKVFVVSLPPLRERGREELDALTAHILDGFRRQFGKDRLTLASETAEVLAHYRWPGNIRELQNALRSAALLADDALKPEHLPVSVQSGAKAPAPENAAAVTDVVKRMERGYIQAALKRFGGDEGKAAEALGLDLQDLKRKVAEYGL